MKLWEYVGKNIKVLSDGQIVEGYCDGYTQALDNDTEIASISIEKEEYSIEIYENEIESIEIM